MPLVKGNDFILVSGCLPGFILVLVLELYKYVIYLVDVKGSICILGHWFMLYMLMYVPVLYSIILYLYLYYIIRYAGTIYSRKFPIT